MSDLDESQGTSTSDVPEAPPGSFRKTGLHNDDEKTHKLIAEFRAKAADLIEEFCAKDSEFALDVRNSDRGVERWLIARKFHLDNAIKMFAEAIHWREEKKIDQILETPFPKAKDIKVKYPHGHHKFDKYGRPVYIERTGILDVKDLLTVTNMDEMLQYHLHMTEYFRKYVCPRGAALRNTYVDQVCTILDLKGLGMGHFNQTVLNFIKSMADIDQANYPEILGQLFIINVPYIFWMGWKVITPFLDDRTKSKIQLIRGNGLSELTKIIAEEDIPTFLGGKCECEGGCLDGCDTQAQFTILAEIGKPEYDRRKAESTNGATTTSSESTTKDEDTQRKSSDSSEEQEGGVKFHD